MKKWYFLSSRAGIIAILIITLTAKHPLIKFLGAFWVTILCAMIVHILMCKYFSQRNARQLKEKEFH